MDADDRDVPAIVGRRIADLRRASGMSLSELARRAGLGKGTLSELEAGHRNPTLETLYALTAPLGVGLATLIDLGGSGAGARGAVSGDGVSAILLDVFSTAPAVFSEVPAVFSERAGHGATEVYRLILEPGARRVSPAHGPGVREQLTGVSGEALVGRIGSEQRVVPGVTVSWTSDVEHSFAAVGEVAAQGVLLITHPA
ncbi:transcriptional regulator with XRE-family HTH domain [Nakamurella sp. UYEF19]|uniref:helix-turn-helix transcriptional regulator n=1 Tax=Nakamurella sp. UYEF19 TaxID=1756392 RepID=UPI003390CEBD